jgi:hypothetical protein
VYAFLHRLAYSQGWAASGAFAAVAIVAFPFALGAAVVISALSVTIAAFTFWTECMERAMRDLRERGKAAASRSPPDPSDNDAQFLRAHGYSESDITAIIASKRAVAERSLRKESVTEDR